MESKEATRIPSFGWKVKLNHVFPEKWTQSMRPSLKQIIPLIPLFVRYVVEFVWLFFKGRKPTMNFIRPVNSKCWSGVPLGGIGGGTIGRGFRGEFCRYQMQPGNYEYHVIHANQFIVTVQKENGETVYQNVLSPLSKPKDGSLSAWSWDFPGTQAEYTALYPRAWTAYSIPEHGLRLICRQISPVIPNNYKDSSVPGGVFVWSVENSGNDLLYVSITFTVKNGTGSKNDKKGGCWNEQFELNDCKVSVKGILMNQMISNMHCTYAVSSVFNDDITVTRMVEFDPTGNGQLLWNQLTTHGELSEAESKSQCTGKGQQTACAVCARVLVPALSTKKLEFALMWDMPKIHFLLKSKIHVRYYTKYFGSDGKAGPMLSHYALSNYRKWEEDIHNWQSLILDDLNLPEWYKSAIFNELYYVTDGGTVWLLTDPAEKFNVNDPRLEYGRFAYLEGHEYRMYNTYDVHFYASFALSQLWPKLQSSIQYEFRDAVVKNMSQPRWYLYNGKIGPRKPSGCMPHDIGEPDEDPFLLINAYNIHDVSEWRDLNLKFVLQCFRDYSQNENLIYIKDMWPQLNTVMEIAQAWDRDGDGLIENAGFPDQTYDAWTMTGPSAYCGSLWIGALYSMVQLSQLLNETSHVKKYLELLDKAKSAFHEKLWNGQYYNFDCSRSGHKTSVMTDQLSGLWYLRASGVMEEVLPTVNVQSALQTIYRLNVMRYCSGKMGAVNGMMPDGTVDRCAVQSEEVWTGVVYGLAAFMIHEGMVEEGFNTARGIYDTVYNRIGLGFDTPEALHERNVYRSVGYMRPLSIWAMQLAWQAEDSEQNYLHSDYMVSHLPVQMESKKTTWISSFGWKVKLNHVFSEKWSQNFKFNLKQISPLIPFFIRYLIYFVWLWLKGQKPIVNCLKPLNSKCWSGVPLGGIGGGTISRGFRGEFCRYQMQPGNYEYNVVHANQFIVTIQNQNGKSVYQKVLSPLGKPKDGSLSAWSWEFPGIQAEYTALYPRAWTVYSIPEYGLRLICRQISPVIPNNYKDSSLPGAVFIWSIENSSSEFLYVSITFTMKNGTGSKNDKKGGCWNELFERTESGISVKGICMNQLIHDMPCTYAVSAVTNDDVTVSHMIEFDPTGDGQTLWNQLATHGQLNGSELRSHCSGKGQQIACAVCASVLVPALSTKVLEFALVWDMPRIHFSPKSKEQIRYYTKYFGVDGKAGPRLSHYALSNYQKWEEDIHEWQHLILDDLSLPEWYKSAIFNELYFVADGGTLWLLTNSSEKLSLNDPRLEYGRFAYLEGHEYRMYNTYDVHFYASFSLSQLWPKLQGSIQYDFRDSIEKNISTPRWHLYNGKMGARKQSGYIPHDLGDPEEEPFVLINAYNMHDISEWRDLNLKFVLQCFRDYSQSRNLMYIKDMWPQLNTVMEVAQAWDRDGDGMIENSGFPDQTYDAWSMIGPSAYCGSLWIGALYSMVQMSELLGETSHAEKYFEILNRAKTMFHEKLWNGQYYNYDCSKTVQHASIMADQLAGLWYLRASGVTEEVFPTNNVQSVLKTIYRMNVMSYCDGKMGAVNGMMPDGTVVRDSIQSEEVWTGVAYALAAFMIHEGMIEEGFTTARGIYETVYNHIGLGFASPEALNDHHIYRSVGYMRPLSIWAIQLAWEANKRRQ